MSEGEFTIEPGRVPEKIKGTLEIVETSQRSSEERRRALQDQIDNFLKLASNESSGLTPTGREALQNHAKKLKDALDNEGKAWEELKTDLAERGWSEEGEEMTQKHDVTQRPDVIH